MAASETVVEMIRSGTVRTREQLQRAKLAAARAEKAPGIPSNSQLLAALEPSERQRFLPLLRTKPMRTQSGVAIVAVQSSPEWCPHGTCTFCPGGPPTSSAKSYTGHEPAARRAIRHAFDPYDQTAARIQQLQGNGHSTDKIDFVLMGGTFTARDLDYQQWFVKRCYDAMNDDGQRSTNRRGGPGALMLEEAMQRNETASNRCIGMTVETKPDWCRECHIEVALGFGATRIELGIQTTFDEILTRVHRGHTVADSIEATRLVKDAGLKLGYHMMPGLPGSSPQRDVASFRRIFEDPDFRPDFIKIYPTLVIPGTRLYEDWRAGRYEPYSTEEAADVVAQCKMHVPPWVRIHRVDRDIPTPQIAAGVDKTNLRQIALARLGSKYGRSCGCIRCREVGLDAASDPAAADELVLHRETYAASGGTEVFISLEDQDQRNIAGYVRLRRLGPTWRADLQPDGAIVRELKVYGRAVPLGKENTNAWQHRGLGRRLMDAAESMARDDWGLESVSVLPGVGVRQYYARTGYEARGPYMEKRLSSGRTSATTA